MAMDFKSIASKKMAEIERPPLPPVGTYKWRVTKLPEVSTSTDQKWDIVNFSIRIVEPMSGVDMDDWKGDIANVLDSIRFMFNKEDDTEFAKSEFRLRTFLEKHLKCAGPDDSLMTALNNAVNAQFLADLTWRPDKDNKDILYTNIGRTAPLD